MIFFMPHVNVCADKPENARQCHSGQVLFPERRNPGPTRFPFLCGGLDVDADSGSGRQRNEHFKAELFPFASDQIGHAGLADAQEPRFIRVRPEQY